MEGTGFVLKDSLIIPGIKATANLYVHKVHGSQFLHVDTDDTHNFFAAAFKTFPESDKGTAHALEHMVLHGSKKYPITDVFFEIDKRSINTFLNAFTAHDFTAYPFGSINETDFHNLMDIYLDAVFNPNLLQDHFNFEVHHIEFSEKGNKNSPLINSGVVFNEMKGSYSDPDDVFYEANLCHAIPDTSYIASNGGKPEDIAKLTCEELRELHSRYYVPGNCRFYHYGAFDVVKVAKHIEQFLSEIPPKPFAMPKSVVTVQPKILETRRKTVEGALDTSVDANTQNRVSVSWLIGDLNDTTLSFDITVLNKLLTDNASSPIYKALLKSGLATDFCASGAHTDHFPVFYTIGVKGVSNDNVEKVFEAIDSTLKDIAENGFDPKAVETVLHSIELKTRAIPQNQGYSLFRRVSEVWIHDISPLSVIDVTARLDSLRERINANPRYFEDMIKHYLLENKARSELIQVPSAEYLTKKDAEEKRLLEEKRKSLTDAEAQAIIDLKEHIEATIEKPSPVEMLPKIRLSDMDTEFKGFVFKKEDDITVFPIPLNDVSYVRIKATLPTCSENIFITDILANSICNLGGDGISDSEFAMLENLYTGGFIGRGEINPDPNDPNKAMPSVYITTHCLNKNFDEMLKLIRIILFNPDFDNTTALKNLIEQQESYETSILNGRGLKYTQYHASRGLNRLTAIREMMRGLTYIHNLRQIIKEADYTKVSSRLKKFFTEELAHAKFEICLHCDENMVEENKAKLTKLLGELRERSGDISQQNVDYTIVDSFIAEARQKKKMLVEFSTSSNNTGAAFPAPKIYDVRSSKNTVLHRIIRSDFFVKAIRQKIGAYGGVAINEPLASVGVFASFRESNPTAVMDAFNSVITEVSNGGFDDEMLENAIVHTVALYDEPVAPSEKGVDIFKSNLSEDYFRKRRIGAMDTKREDILESANEIKNADWAYSIVGSTTTTPAPEGFEVVPL